VLTLIAGPRTAVLRSPAGAGPQGRADVVGEFRLPLNGLVRAKNREETQFEQCPDFRIVIFLHHGASAARFTKATMAFRQADGSVAWAKGSIRTAYSSPMIVNLDGLEQLVQLMDGLVFGLNPHNGDL
jgi:hypothetical protein